MDKVLHDARHWQIAALSTLLVYSIAGFDFGASILPSTVAIGTSLAMQFACSKLWRRRGYYESISPSSRCA